MRSLFFTCLLVLFAAPAAEAQRDYDCGSNGCPGSGGNNRGGDRPRPPPHNGGGNWGNNGYRPQIPNYPPPVPQFWPQQQQPYYQQPRVTYVTLCGWEQVWTNWGYQQVERCYNLDTRPGYDAHYQYYLSLRWTVRLF